MKNLKFIFILGLFAFAACKQEPKEDKFEKDQGIEKEEDCGCDDVDTTVTED